jgi:hypothetical protein
MGAEEVSNQERSVETNPMLFFRTISELMRMFILPEVHRRRLGSKIMDGSSPLQILKAMVAPPSTQRPRALVRLNNEVKIIVTTKAKRAFAPGEELTARDLDLDSCTLIPPQEFANEKIYFLIESYGFIFRIFIGGFQVDETGESDPARQATLEYPMREHAALSRLWEDARPIEKFEMLADDIWKIHRRGRPSSKSGRI